MSGYMDKRGAQPFFYRPWRYCMWCGRCHSGLRKWCRQENGEPGFRMNPGQEEGEPQEPSREPEKARHARRQPQEQWQDGPEEEGEPDGGAAFEVTWWPGEAGDEADEGRGRQDPGGRTQAHVHEFEGSTKLAEFREDVHNHRIAGVSGEAVKTPGSHVHRIWTRTDFFDHYHLVNQHTGPAVYVGSSKPRRHPGQPMYKDEQHIHYVKGVTSEQDGHDHEFQLATQIDSPLLPQPGY